ncbi:MAG: hypothetical protein QOE70_651 [Chthoniobacter sp.]|nr:hypothetical protein [Chthoniobacter sp.]
MIVAILKTGFAEEKTQSSGITAEPAAAGTGVQVGVARRDGVTASGTDMFITRGGQTEKLAKDLVLPSGVTVRPNGTLRLADGTEVTLRESQLLTLEGAILDLPADPNVNAGVRATTKAASGGEQTTGPGQPGYSSTGSSRSTLRERSGANGSLFLDGGVPATTVLPEGQFGATGGVINPDGTVTRTDGTVAFPDGSVRSSNGTLISGPTQTTTTTTQGTNTTSNDVSAGATTRTRGDGSQMTIPPNTNQTMQNTNSTGTNRNSPKNAGTVNTNNQAQSGSSSVSAGVTTPAGSVSVQGNTTRSTGTISGTAAGGAKANGAAVGSGAGPAGR